MTSAGFNTGFKKMPRACVSRARWASTVFSVSASGSRSCDWRKRPEANRTSCCAFIPTCRADAISSFKARRPARSMRPVVVRAWMRSSAAVSGPAISAPMADTSSRHRSSLGDFAWALCPEARAECFTSDRSMTFLSQIEAVRRWRDPLPSCGFQWLNETSDATADAATTRGSGKHSLDPAAEQRQPPQAISPESGGAKFTRCCCWRAGCEVVRVAGRRGRTGVKPPRSCAARRSALRSSRPLTAPRRCAGPASAVPAGIAPAWPTS